MSKHELESAPRVTTRRTTVFRLDIQISGLFDEATLRWLRTFCRWRTPVRAAVLRRTPSEGGALGAARPTRRSRGSPSLKLRRTETRDPTLADGMGCRPYRCGDRPGGSQPPVCQGTAFPLRRNVEIIHYRADGRKGEVISTAQQRHDFLPFEEHGSHHIDDGVI